jgi:hypothetical protein
MRLIKIHYETMEFTTFFKTYVIKPTERASVQNRHLQEVTYSRNGVVVEKRRMHKTKAVKQDGESTPDSLGFRRDELNPRKYNAGMQETLKNPWRVTKEEEVEGQVNYVLSQYGLNPGLWREKLVSIVKQENITAQQFGEIRFGLEPDELTDRVPSERPTKEKPDIRTRLMKTKLVLYDRNNYLSEDNLEGWLKIRMAQRRPDKIATSLENMNTAVHNWIIMERQEEQKLSTGLNLKKNLAKGKLAEYGIKYPVTNNLEENVLYFMASILMSSNRKGEFKPVIKGITNAMTIDDKLNTFLEVSDKNELEQNIERFNETVEMFETQPELFFAKYFVQQGLNTGTVQINNGTVYWVSQKENIERYKFTSVNAFETVLFSEMNKIESGFFEDFIRELQTKTVVIPENFVSRSN